MREIIDAHAHLTPSGVVGTVNERLGIGYLPYGAVSLPDGTAEQVMPEIIADSSFTAETMLRVMERHGVGRAIIMCNALSILDETVRAVKLYPGRFSGAMRIPQGRDMLRVFDAYYAGGLRVIKFEMSPGFGYTHPEMYPRFRLDDPDMDKLYARAGEMGVTITVDPFRIGSDSYQVEALRSVTERFPATHFVICHLGYPDVPMPEGSPRRSRWREMTDLARRENVWFDMAALSDFYRDEGSPYPSAAALVRRFMDDYGADRVIWGSDAPGSLMGATYRQMIDLVEKSPLFTETEKDLIFSGNAKRAYRL